MKEVINSRIKRIEELLKAENTVCMVARRDEHGVHWNGRTYTDEKELSEAVRAVVGDYSNTPLVIISKVMLTGERSFEKKSEKSVTSNDEANDRGVGVT